jgi:hypothetical protein
MMGSEIVGSERRLSKADVFSQGKTHAWEHQFQITASFAALSVAGLPGRVGSF